MDYTDWMDGPGGYREWYEANFGDDDDTSELRGAHPNIGGGDGPPPKPPVKQ